MAETSGDIRKVIEANNGKWNDAFNRGDARAVMSLYVDDAKLLPPTNVVVSGSQEIRAFWEALIKNGFGNHAIEIVEVRAIGDIARRFYYDELVFEPNAVRFLVETFGKTQIVVGTDYPFALGDTKPMKTLENAAPGRRAP